MLFSFFLFSPLHCWAYSSDVHMCMTRMFCAMNDMTPFECIMIALSDQDMDVNDTTTALKLDPVGLVNVLPQHSRNGREWHAFYDSSDKTLVTDDQKRSAVLGRLKELKKACFDSSSGPDGILLGGHFGGTTMTERQLRRLIRFGQYLHFQQDYYSHREMDKTGPRAYLSDETCVPYGSEFGHLKESIVPDCIPSRIDLAKKMAANSYETIREFSINVLGNNPLPVTPGETDRIIEGLASAYTPGRVASKTDSPVKSASGPHEINIGWAFPSERAAYIAMIKPIAQVENLAFFPGGYEAHVTFNPNVEHPRVRNIRVMDQFETEAWYSTIYYDDNGDFDMGKSTGIMTMVNNGGILLNHYNHL